MLILNKIAQPSAPSSGKIIEYIDTADGRQKVIDEYGNIYFGTDVGLRSRNILGNGSFDWAQRQVPVTLTTYSCASNTARIMTADRWGLTNQTASTQFQQIDTASAEESGLNCRFYGKYKQITGAGKIMVTQAMPNSSIEHVLGKYVRFQCKMKYSIAASMAIRIGIIRWSGTVDTIPGAQNVAGFMSAFGVNGTDPAHVANFGYITPFNCETNGNPANVSLDANGVTCVLGNTWNRFSGSFYIPTNTNNLLVGIWSNDQLAALDELNIAEIGLYDGMEVRDWYTLSSPLEYERIRRYYQKTFALATAPAQSAGNVGAIQFMAGRAAALVNTCYYTFPTPMLKTPTVTIYNPGAANAQARDLTVPGDCSSTTAANTTENSVTISTTGNATTAVGNPIAFHLALDSEI